MFYFHPLPCDEHKSKHHIIEPVAWKTQTLLNPSGIWRNMSELYPAKTFRTRQRSAVAGRDWSGGVFSICIHYDSRGSVVIILLRPHTMYFFFWTIHVPYRQMQNFWPPQSRHIAGRLEEAFYAFDQPTSNPVVFVAALGEIGWCFFWILWLIGILSLKISHLFSMIP